MGASSCLFSHGSMACMLACFCPSPTALPLGDYPYPSSYLLHGKGNLPAYPVRVACESLSDPNLPSNNKSLLLAMRESLDIYYNYTWVEFVIDRIIPALFLTAIVAADTRRLALASRMRLKPSRRGLAISDRSALAMPAPAWATGITSTARRWCSHLPKARTRYGHWMLVSFTNDGD